MRRSLLGGGGGKTVASVSVTSANLAIGATKQLTATATYTDGSSADVTSSSVWSTANAGVATVSGTALLTAVASGATKVKATIGGKTGESSVLVGHINLDVDLTTNPAPATVAITRTGDPCLAQRSQSTAQLVAANTVVCEDKGDGLGNGWWSFDAYINYVADIFDHRPVSPSGLWTNGNVTLNAGADVGPDGVQNADELVHANAQSAGIGFIEQDFAINAGAPVTHSLWVKDSPVAPSVVGKLTDDADADGASIGSGQTWRRVVKRIRFATATGGHRVDVTGAAGTPGAIRVCGDQKIPGNLHDLPTMDRTTQAQLIQLAAGQLVNILDANGDLDIEGWMLLSLDISQANSDACLFSMNTPLGFCALSVVAGTGQWNLTINGVVVWAPAFSGTNYPGWGVEGYPMRWRLWWKPSAGRAGLRVTVNGATYEMTTVPSVGAIGVPTSFYLGSNLGAGPFFQGRFQRLRTYSADANAPLLPEVLIVGDSISAPAAVGGVSMIVTSAAIYTTEEATRRTGIFSLAIPGQTCEEQQAVFDASPYSSPAGAGSNVRAVIIRCFVNNLVGAAQDAVTATASLQALISDVKAKLPTAIIIVEQMSPAKGFFDTGPSGLNPATLYANWQAANANIAGTGLHPVTGVDHVITDTQLELNDGADYLRTEFDCGDHIHPITLARLTVIGPNWRKALNAVGVM